MPPYARGLIAKKRPLSDRMAAARAKKGRTGTKRRSAGTMRKHAAPVSMGTSMKRGKSGPAGMGYSMKQVSDTCTRITGRAYVGEVNTSRKITLAEVSGSVPKANALGLIFDINPSLLNDRVAVISSTFQKYVYQSVKFTYVPQCSTAVSGSVGLVFDRDPLMISANTQGSQFLSEVMSYEHATLTPAYVGASASYQRDPKELKTWFLGAPDATTTTRETSQGNLMCYLSNCEKDKGYGFIVMDYVLDLIAPTLLPAKQGIIDIKKAPSQWVDCSAAAACTGETAGGALATTVIDGVTYDQNFSAPAWETNFTGDVAGCVGEIQLGGFSSGAGTPLDPVYPGTMTISNAVGNKLVDASGVSVKFAFGQKLYFCIHGVVGSNGQSGFKVWSWHTTLSSARSSATNYAEGAAAVGLGRMLPDQLFIRSGGNTVYIGGWARLINEGSGSEDTA